MADRGAIEIFAAIFEKLASDPTPQHKQWARELWKLSLDFDFNERQLQCDEQLLRLELARLSGSRGEPVKKRR
jgi:hypothetical protein